MSWLPSRLPLAPVMLLHSVRPWPHSMGFVTVMAILGKLPFHLSQARLGALHLLEQGGNLGSLRCQLCLNPGRLGSFFGHFHFQLCDVFFCYHGLF